MVLKELSELEELQPVIDLSKQNKSLLVIDCYASWCGPCKKLTPVLEELSDELSNVDIAFIPKTLY